MKLRLMGLAIAFALVGCKDDKTETKTKTETKKSGADAAPPGPSASKETGPLPEVPAAATRNDVRPVAYIRIAADSALTVGAIPEEAIDGGTLAGALPAGTAVELDGLLAAIQELDDPARAMWIKQKAVADAKHAGIIAPTPPAWPRGGDLHARQSQAAQDDPWAPVVFAVPEVPAARLLEVLRATGRGAEIAVRTDGGAVSLLHLFIDHVTWGSGTEEPSEVLVVIRRGDDPVEVFDKAIADKQRSPESGDPRVRLQPGEGVTAGELVGAIAALGGKSPLGMVLGQPGPGE